MFLGNSKSTWNLMKNGNFCKSQHLLREQEPKTCLESDSMKMKLQLGECTPNLSMDNEILIPNI